MPPPFSFSTELVVRFAETDAQGIAHNSAYLVWFEVGRIDYLARHAGGYKRIQAEGVEALTTESHVRHLAAACFDDRLRIHLRCGDLRGARFRFDYLVERVGDGRPVPVADGWTLHALVDRDTLRPTRLPEWLREAIERAEAGGPGPARPRRSRPRRPA
ncbi:MAG TPA: thioesterase family protein [Gaiellaceae bacterium]|nr:thioesterase family protein [Gaiellaceae bacterium]HZT53798.1 thioesterase family protein [Gaiellaceae bacterium]